MTADKLHQIEMDWQRANELAQRALARRNRAIREALAEGKTHEWAAEATGLTRGRIGQISLMKQRAAA